MSDQIPIESQQVPLDNAEELKNRMEEMDKEAARLRELHSQLESDSTNGFNPPTDEEKRDADAKSIYIGNVDYASTPLELQQHFSSAGVVNRVTILTDKFTGHPKGFAYLEFADVEGVEKAVATLDGSTFRELSAKRTNIPGINVRRGGPSRGRGGFRGGRGNFRGGRGGRGGRGNFRGGRGGGPRYTPY
ncbi:pab2 Polyadenylate-binding protein 2 [Candida maltosa Xu316]